jgi:hypothetical protein
MEYYTVKGKKYPKTKENVEIFNQAKKQSYDKLISIIDGAFEGDDRIIKLKNILFYDFYEMEFEQDGIKGVSDFNQLHMLTLMFSDMISKVLAHSHITGLKSTLRKLPKKDALNLIQEIKYKFNSHYIENDLAYERYYHNKLDLNNELNLPKEPSNPLTSNTHKKFKDIHNEFFDNEMLYLELCKDLPIVNSSFNSKMNEEQIALLYNFLYPNYIKTELNDFESIFSAEIKPQPQPIKWEKSNRLLAYFFFALNQRNFIETKEWQSIIEKNKLFLNKKGKLLNAGDIATALHEIQDSKPIGSNSIDEFLKKIETLRH